MPWRLSILGLWLVLLITGYEETEDELFSERNFYGSVQVVGRGLGTPAANHQLKNDGIAHGSEFLQEKFRQVPVTYYSAKSGIGLVLLNFKRDHRRVGIVGLGAGTLATYGQPGDTFHFFEINPVMDRIAREYFFYLENSRASVEIIEGDARLTLERQHTEQYEKYDILVIDAFNGNAVPFHLLTEEAWQLYWSRLVTDGALVIHVSNKHLDLIPVVLHLNQYLRKGILSLVENDDDTSWDISASSWIVITDNPAILDATSFNRVALTPPGTHRVIRWTDKFSPVVPVVFWSLPGDS